MRLCGVLLLSLVLLASPAHAGRCRSLITVLGATGLDCVLYCDVAARMTVLLAADPVIFRKVRAVVHCETRTDATVFALDKQGNLLCHQAGVRTDDGTIGWYGHACGW